MSAVSRVSGPEAPNHEGIVSREHIAFHWRDRCDVCYEGGTVGDPHKSRGPPPHLAEDLQRQRSTINERCDPSPVTPPRARFRCSPNAAPAFRSAAAAPPSAD